MLKIESNSFGCCTSNHCMFKFTCSVHHTAGTVRETEGFTPEVFQDDETEELFCKTAHEQPYGDVDPVPENESSLGRGFQALPHKEESTLPPKTQSLLSRVCNQ
jgi:hypothetical protein